jgi:Pregnancy-associated plasma protein-A/Secretion system C-terminal sorting domain
MKNWKIYSLFSLLLLIGLADATAQLVEKRCVSYEVNRKKCLNDVDYAKRQTNFKSKINQYLATNSKNKRTSINELIRIPIAVHVIHNSTSNLIGGKNNPNISEEQIKSQIDVLNEDYRRKSGTLGFNSNPIGADMNIEFYLADNDPDGNNTNGITRTFSTKTSFDPFSDSDQQLMSDLAYWPSECYLNIWIVSLQNNYLGYSQFPSAPNFDGLDEISNDKLDGLYIDYRYFGRNSAAITSKYYKYGRTTTHEIGHWLGLIHTWGDEDCGDDYCADTPQANGPNLTIFCKDIFSNCTGKSTKNMIENYLDYTIDSCMNTFTIDQMARVRAVFELSPLRKKLVECSTRLPESENLQVEINPNPATENLTGKIFVKGATNVDIAIFDLYGKEIDRKVFENKRSFNFTIPINNYPQGLYIVNVIAQGQRISKRILVSNK